MKKIELNQEKFGYGSSFNFYLVCMCIPADCQHAEDSESCGSCPVQMHGLQQSRSGGKSHNISSGT